MNFLLLHLVESSKSEKTIDFSGKDCKTLNQWDQDFVEVSSSKEICVDAEEDAFVIFGSKNDIIMTDEEGKTYENAYGACQGKYLIKSSSRIRHYYANFNIF